MLAGLRGSLKTIDFRECFGLEDYMVDARVALKRSIAGAICEDVGGLD